MRKITAGVGHLKAMLEVLLD